MAKTFTGTVVSTKMKDTVVVQTERKFRHAKYSKVIIRHKKYKAHNDVKDIKVNDTVSIVETRPYSKDVYFRVVSKS